MNFRRMAFAIYDFVTFKISMVLEPILDEVEYRFARRGRRQTSETKTEYVNTTAERAMRQANETRKPNP
jgi:hypothetical protein